MKYELFEYTTPGMTAVQRIWRVSFLLAVITVCALDLFVWRP